MRKIQKNFESKNYELIVKSDLKKQQFNQQPNFRPPICPSCKTKTSTKISHGYLCQTLKCVFILLNRNIK